MPVRKLPMFKESLIRRAEYGVSLLATAVILLLHTKVLIHAGALWRDEVNTFNLATMDTLSGRIRVLMEHDSYPGLWFMVLRAWIKLGLGSTDFQLRILGLIIGLGIVVALWWNAWIFGRTIPLLSLLLFGMSPSLLRIGDSLRGYGVGVLLMLLMIGANWRMVECPTWTRALVAGSSYSLLAVQTALL